MWKNQADPRPFYKQKELMRSDIKDTTWYEEYFRLDEQIESKNEENEKMKREIQRRTERYIRNEAEYRKQINLLERELRVRNGYEENATETNVATINVLKGDIEDNIDGYNNQLKRLSEE